MKITKRQLRRIIRESLLRENPEELFVVIGNAGRGRQNTWPKSAEPEAYPEAEAKKIADDLNAKQGSYGMTQIRYHHKPVAKALNFVSMGNEAYGGIEGLQAELGIMQEAVFSQEDYDRYAAEDAAREGGQHDEAEYERGFTDGYDGVDPARDATDSYDSGYADGLREFDLHPPEGDF